MKKITDRLKEIFSLDYRSLALMRIGFGLTLICDLIQRASDLFVFYTDGGVLPRFALLEHTNNTWYWSLHTISGMWQIQAVLFIFAFIAAVFLLVGYRTTLATIISWILLVSLQNRNPLVLQGGDIIFRVVLLWSLFLPWGRYMSVDNVTKHDTIKNKNFFSASTVAYIIQIVIFYLFSALLKTGDAWHNGTAVLQTLKIDQFTTTFGHFLLSYPGLLTLLTSLVLYLEFYGSLLLLSPWRNGPIRTVIVFLFALMQIGLNLSMHLGLFGMISIVVTLGLLPSWFWDTIIQRLKTKVQKRKQSLTIYYDSECSFCFRTVYLLKRLLWLPETVVIKESRTDDEIAHEMERVNSWIVISSDGTKYYKGDGLKEVLKASPLFFWKAYFLSIPVVMRVTNYFYDKVAKKRKLICLPEEVEQKKKYKIINYVVVFLTLYVVIYNIQTLTDSPMSQDIGQITRLDQKWNMFAPTPLTEDGWYVFPGELVNGSLVDVFQNGAPLSYEKPEHGADLYKNQRWQKYLMNLWVKDNSEYRLYYGKYICREWNKKHEGGQQLNNFKMIFMLEMTHPDGSEQTPVPITIWDHVCF